MSTINALVSAWAIVAAAIVILRWRAERGVGLVVAFVLSLTSLHWLAAVLYVLPWYEEALDPVDVTVGLEIALVGLVGFGVGVSIASRAVRRRGTEMRAPWYLAGASLGLWYVAVGVVLYVLALAGLRRVSSIGGLASAGSSAAVFGLCLLIWHARPSRRLLWLALAGLLPIVTIVTQGYLSYGIAALVMVAAFVAEWHKPRWSLVAVGLILTYVAMSFYVTYMRDRREIREAVWGGAAAGERLDVVTGTLTSIELFDPFNDAHLARVDNRLNQNYLVGRAAAWLDNGFVPYGQGRTLVDAALAMVPRALWPEKDVSAGSGDLVSYYTGMEFDEDTSVGIGSVMEFYVNFGVPGVFGGFLLLGVLVLVFDERAGAHLRNGDVRAACLWYLPGISLLQVGGSLVDVTATMAAGFAGAVLTNTAIGALGRFKAVETLLPDVVEVES